MVDAHFAEPRLVELYDVLEGARDDLDAYVALVDEFAARSVLDIGCGTGTLACLLAARGTDVVGVDPAAASLDVARRKPHAGAVRWVLGDATSLPPLQVDLATMTGNVAQVFLTDEDWAAALRGVRAALRPGGRLLFESRRPEREAWREWDRERSLTRVGDVETWIDVTEVRGPLVSFRTTFVVADDVLTSDSVLRFRTLDELHPRRAARLARRGGVHRGRRARRARQAGSRARRRRASCEAGYRLRVALTGPAELADAATRSPPVEIHCAWPLVGTATGPGGG